ncbi:MAG: hypothetical protein SH848_22195 [Saprospiraceae bacterium]|nr:hypothetical protein [Saprospiraceae bacterium]MDZ4706657.1 hypothetical protein [Saprospiraceae bacterium]
MLKKEYLKNKPTCKVTFTLPAEAINGVSEVQVLGDFNNWNHEQGVKMKSVKAGFETTLELAAGRYYEFRYLLDGNIWANDPAADDYHATPYGVYNSVVKIDEVATTSATPAAKAPVAKTAAPKATETKTVAAKTPAPKATETKAVAAKAPAAEKTTAPAKKTTAKAAPKTTKKG